MLLPEFGKFIKISNVPFYNENKIKSLVEYPDLACRSGIEGIVVVDVLVNKNGSILKTIIEYSDHTLLNSAAINAVKAYGNFEPAEQGGKKVACWISVPFTFKLRPLEENKENE